VAQVLPDGKIELSLRGPAHEELARDAAHVLEVLRRPGTPRVGDRSDPAEVRRIFGLSKKAFKRATGRLLKLGQATLDERGWLQPRRR
jgi:predicted RNA-binding protein (virulence factor B family)